MKERERNAASNLSRIPPVFAYVPGSCACGRVTACKCDTCHVPVCPECALTAADAYNAEAAFRCRKCYAWQRAGSSVIGLSVVGAVFLLYCAAMAWMAGGRP